VEGRTSLHLTGAVSIKGAAGFIRARWPLVSKRRPLDARAYDGIRLSVRGNGETYAIHLRTNDTRSPGQYYQAEFQVGGQWQEIKLPFGSFVPVGLTRLLNPAALASIAVVAGKREFNADICISAIALYREKNMNRNLTAEEERVMVRKGTEAPFTGKYYKHFEKGVYTCRRCGAELFESSSKFRSDCGWPSFDEQIPGHVKWQPDADGVRTEIICANCGAHLGHVFLGERLTEQNTRYCVNSISMDFIPAEKRAQKTEDGGQKTDDRRQKTEGSVQTSEPISPPSSVLRPPATERAIFASGCFWGTQYYLQRAPGVISTTVGYTGGHVDHPTYKQVCTGRTGHAESVEVIYDPAKTSYEKLAKLFFETHDFTQLNRQGPDIGHQYRSAIFYLNDEQKRIAERLVQQLRQMGYDVKTEITKAGPFWRAEDYHQDYYQHNGQTPYCHIYRPIFKPQPSVVTSP
jgi:peptide methionine sulfoxide reductase msrA/msrB